MKVRGVNDLILARDRVFYQQSAQVAGLALKLSVPSIGSDRYSPIQGA
jgi:hypothetical protein